MTRLGLTGATGMIGSCLLPRLMREPDYRIRALVRGTPPAQIQAAGSRVEWLLGDLTSAADCVDFVRDLDVIIHLAHTHSPLTSNRDLPGDNQANMGPFLHLLQAIRSARTRPLFVYASSGGSVYGHPRADRRPFREDDPCVPATSYGIQKLMAESYLRMASAEGWLRSVVMRIGNPFGVPLMAERRQGLIGVAFNRIVRGLPVQVIGDPENVRDYVHLADCVEFVPRALSFAESFGVFNVSGGKGYSVKEVFAALQAVHGRPFALETIDVPGSKQHLVPWVVLDVTRARETFGWVPRISLELGLKRMQAALAEGAA